MHFGIPFDDKTRAMQFHQTAFGWQLNDMPQMNYVMANTVAVDENYMPKELGAINGGLIVQAAGGTLVTPKTQIPNMGAFARVMDSERNVIGLYSQSQ